MRAGQLPTEGRLDGCIACNRRLCQFLPDGQNPRFKRDILLKRGERIEASDGACLRFWTVISGTAAICALFEDGRRQIVGIDTKGDTICGLMSVSDNTVWLEALEDCHICELDYSTYAADLRENASFIGAVFALTHKRLETMSRHVATLGRLDSTERVILFLADMARRQEQASSGTSAVSLPMSREDIADYLGLNAETVSRIMSRLKKSGLIRFLTPTEYVVPDFAAVESRLPVPVPESQPDAQLAWSTPKAKLQEFLG